jgi:Fe-S-cluster-containing dehydrogenase component/DMSO reductase anchor subunit
MTLSLLDRLLADQQDLSAVERFSQAHEAGSIPAQSKHYQRLLPTSLPAAGQQYAFEVDLDRCSGCKACVTACHSLNGLDETETWRDVGLLIGGTATKPVMQHVTTACHHCLEPACMIACPVNAYEKNPLTGIVKHLDDQCFGCQYCVLACPYDVPKYHSGKGIVRKCDMCSDRLSAGEAPACVQACPNEAIAIKIVDVRQVIEDSEAALFLPAAPEPQITLPTTTYKTTRVFPRNLLPVDYHSVNPQHPHWPLIVMLVLTQLSVGAFFVGGILDLVLEGPSQQAFRPVQTISALAFGLLALGASVFHLGRPQFAFRAVLGLRHSWLSREIVAFGGFAGAACLFAAVAQQSVISTRLLHALGGAVALLGAAGVFCSIMIYVFTQREFWSFGQTATKFVLTSAVLGIAATWITLWLIGTDSRSGPSRELMDRAGRDLARALIVAAGMKLAFEAIFLRHLLGNRHAPLKRSARLMTGALSNPMLARFMCGALGGIVMPLLLLQPFDGADGDGRVRQGAIVGLLFVACLAGEMLERYVFFAAVAAPRMPGALRT